MGLALHAWKINVFLWKHSADGTLDDLGDTNLLEEKNTIFWNYVVMHLEF